PGSFSAACAEDAGDDQAEGIETEAQLERLHRLGCDFGQGFLWSTAVPCEEVYAMLRRLVRV
ncbi:MAG: hypothetical protein ACLPKZ_09075, partial [Acidimicrobiales bacterium]